MPILRNACEDDLPALLKLYTELSEVNAMPDAEAFPRVSAVWRKILADEDHYILVCQNENTGELFSSCVLVIIPNLTHNQRPYALIENVVTASAHRGRGYATQLLQLASEIAARAGCYKVMLMTGSKRASTLQFYENAGFDPAAKTAFLKRL